MIVYCLFTSLLFFFKVLWPVFHYLVQTSSGDSRAEKRHWDDYVAVNQQFADTVIDRYQPNDISKYYSKERECVYVLVYRPESINFLQYSLCE